MTNRGSDIDGALESMAPRGWLIEKLPATLLLVVALGWIAGIRWSLAGGAPPGLLNAIALASGPVALILIAGLLWGVTSERSARRFARTAQAMRDEAMRLETVLAAMAERMTELQQAGAETSEGIAGVNDAMSANIDTLGRHSLLLGAAATAAREEMKTLVTDLPRIEERMSQMTGLLGGAGQIVEGHATALQALLLALTQKGREAEEVAVAAASKLAEQLDRIEALGKAVDPALLADAAERANRTAQAAGAHLARQMAALSDAISRLEARVATAAQTSREAEDDQFSHRATLLIDALNSAAIDVTRLLSREVAEAQWAAYLRGERGVFTRAAVTLLARSEAREIRRLYAEDAEFHAQVGRYIHDFEALLRPLLARDDGTALSMVLISSDMGKLYVALAQAIERLRR